MHHSIKICGLVVSGMLSVMGPLNYEYIFSLFILIFLMSLHLNLSTYSFCFLSMYDDMIYNTSLDMLMVSMMDSNDAKKEQYISYPPLQVYQEPVSILLFTLLVYCCWTYIFVIRPISILYYTTFMGSNSCLDYTQYMSMCLSHIHGE